MTYDVFDIPNVDWFEFKNGYSGSCGNLNYMFKPIINDEEKSIEVICWYGKKCLKLSEISDNKTFEMSNSGIMDAMKWLCTKK